MPRPRLSSWIANDSTKSAPPGSPAERDLGLLLSTLRSGAPGQWSQNVFELSRHFKSAAYLAVNTLAKHAMDSAFSLYERTDDPDAPNGEVELPWYDPACRLFEDPNPVDTFSDLMYQTVQQLSITGMALTWCPPTDANDEPAEMYSLPTANCWPLPISPMYPQGAYRVLPYPFGLLAAPVGQIASGAVIPAEQIVRVKNNHPYLRYDGYAVMTAIGQSIDTLEAIDQSRFATMSQGCEQSLAMSSTSPMSQDPSEEDIKRFRKQLEVLYAGPKNAGKIFFPPTGWDLKQISTTPKDMAWQDGWSQVLDFILASFGVPKAVAGLQDSLSYATLYSSLRAFCLFSLGPIVRQIARGWNKGIVWPSWGKEIGLRITAPEFKDETLEETKFQNDLKCGLLLGKEGRKLRGYDHLDPAEEAWVNERLFANYNPAADQAQDQGGDNGTFNAPGPESGKPMANDPNVDNARPASKSQRAEMLAKALEKAKTNGHARPITN